MENHYKMKLAIPKGRLHEGVIGYLSKIGTTAVMFSLEAGALYA